MTTNDGPEIPEFLSLGAGVQSTTMALMAAHGLIEPMPTAAIFADTGAEPESVYEHLDWLRSPNVLPFPVQVVQWRDLGADIEASARGEDVAGRTGGYVAPPFFVASEHGGTGMLRRECTTNYKIRPIHAEVKRQLGIPPDRRARARRGQPLARQWIGISCDEASRMKPSMVAWIETRHPLIEANMTRGHCLEWLARHEYPSPPSSACVFCPYRSAREFRQLSTNDMARAVEIDGLIRDLPMRRLAGFGQGGHLYVSSTLRPLGEVDITDPHERQGNLFREECEGMCGV